VAVNLDQGVPTATGSFATLIGALQFLPAVQLPGVLDEASPQSLQVWRHMAFDDATFASQQTGNHLANGRDGITGFDGSQFHAMDSTVDPSLSQIKGRLLAWSPTLRPGLLSDSASPVLAGVDMKEVKSAPTNEMSADQWSTFVAGDVILADLSHNEDLAHQDYTTGSVTLGADYRLDAHFTVGGLFAYGHTDADLDHIGSKTTDDSYSPGVYASYVDGGWYGNGLFSYGYNSYTSDRNIKPRHSLRRQPWRDAGQFVCGQLDGGLRVQAMRVEVWSGGQPAICSLGHQFIHGTRPLGAQRRQPERRLLAEPAWSGSPLRGACPGLLRPLYSYTAHQRHMAARVHG